MLHNLEADPVIEPEWSEVECDQQAVVHLE